MLCNAAPVYCLGFLFRSNRNEVALILKKKPDFMRFKLNGIGGKVEWGESPLDAMRREFQEETGCDTFIDWLSFCQFTVTENSASVFCYAAQDDLVNLKSMTDEPVLWTWRNELPHQSRMSNLDWLVPLAAESLGNPTSARMTLAHP